MIELDYLPDAVGRFRHPEVAGGRSMNIVGLVPNGAERTLTLGLTDPTPLPKRPDEEEASDLALEGSNDSDTSESGAEEPSG